MTDKCPACGQVVPARCTFVKSWIGQCKQATAEGSPDRCADHIALKCINCGARATRDCEHTGFFVCGAPLCADCRHSPTISEDPFQNHCEKTRAEALWLEHFKQKGW